MLLRKSRPMVCRSSITLVDTFPPYPLAHSREPEDQGKYSYRNPKTKGKTLPDSLLNDNPNTRFRSQTGCRSIRKICVCSFGRDPQDSPLSHTIPAPLTFLFQSSVLFPHSPRPEPGLYSLLATINANRSRSSVIGHGIC